MPGPGSRHGFSVCFPLLFRQSAKVGEVGEVVTLEKFVHGVFVAKTAEFGDLAEGEVGGDGVFFDLFELFVLDNLAGAFADGGGEQAVYVALAYVELLGEVGDGDTDAASAVDGALHSADPFGVFVRFGGEGGGGCCGGFEGFENFKKEAFEQGGDDAAADGGVFVVFLQDQ